MKTRYNRLFIVYLIIVTILIFTACGADTTKLGGNAGGTAESAAEEAAYDEADDDGLDDAADTDAQAAAVRLGARQNFYDSSDFLADIPEWSGSPHYYINGNIPTFELEEIWQVTQESLDPLDELGRCGTANSCIGVDGMPSGGRGSISEIHPTGWHTERYDFVEGEALFNRCHLVAHQLSGDDAIDRNLITGTSYMNRAGMLPFEEAVGDYVRGTGNHVMYRVTPVFAGEELVARGVHMQAISVEDNGEGICFNVFCYNVQPGIEIDYATGDNHLANDKDEQLRMAAEFAGVAALTGGGLNALFDDETAAEYDKMLEAAEDQESAESADTKANTRTYVLNTNTGKFHYPNCKSVSQMKEKNKKIVEATREAIIDMGYVPCKNCNP